MSKQVTLMTDAIPYQEFAAPRSPVNNCGKLTGGDTSSPAPTPSEHAAAVLNLLDDGVNTGAYEIVNWKELSERGLVFRINHEIMHQLGLAVMYEPETGVSGGAMVAADGVWNYSNDQMVCAKKNR